MLTFVDKTVIMKDQILITAPLPPPIHGMSLATKLLIDGTPEGKFIIIDTAMEKSILAFKQPSVFSPKRFTKIITRLFLDSYKIITSSYCAHYLCVGMDYRGIVRYFPYVILSILKRKPYVIHVHNGSFGALYNSLSGTKKYIIHFMFSRAAAVITLGESLREIFQGAVKNENIKVVENCVDDNHFATSEQIEEKKKSVNLPIKILYMSNLMVNKGIFDLMESVAQMDGYELHIAGAIEQKEATQQRIHEILERHKGKFFYYGILTGEAKKNLFTQCDIFALPSYNEGQPISILEAYANGLAVVTDENCGGIKDIFHHTVNGYSCSAGDVESIKKAIEKTSDRLPDFIETNYIYAKSKFKQSDFIDKIHAVIYSLVSDKKSDITCKY